MKALLALCSALLLAVLVGCMPVLPESSTADPATDEGLLEATILAADSVTETSSDTAANSTAGSEPAPQTSTATLTATVVPTGTALPTSTIVPTMTTVPTATVVPTDTAPVTGTVVPTMTTVPTATTVPTMTTVPTGTLTATPIPPAPSGTPSTPGPTAPPSTPPSTPPATPTPSTPAPTVPPTPTVTPTPTEGPPPTNTPLPSTVFVRNDSTYTEGSSLYVVGEAVNGGPAPVYNVQVIATFYNANGEIVGANSGMTLLPRTQPTQANPFKLQLSPPPPNAARYELALTWDDLTIATFDRATITREELNQEGGIEIVGDIRNDHRSELRNLQAVATFYAANGTVVDAVAGSVGSSTLAPGASTTFTIQSSRSFTFDHYLVQVEGMLLP